MKNKKLKYIEAYIYAKILNQISSNTIAKDIQSQEKIDNAKAISKNLLIYCEEKINKLKLNDVSFLVLKNELESESLYHNCFDKNYKKICEMLNNYNDYYKIINT